MRYGCLATFLLPLVLAAQTNPTTPSDQKCTISGRTTSAADGSPLGKATLHLAPNFRGSQSMSRYMAVSNADGSFQFLNIEPGTYKLSADRNGFLQSTYGATRPGGSGKLITVKAGQQLADVKMTLAPQAVISGKLVDEDGDSALADGVAILQQTWIDGKLTYRMRQGTSVDDRGYFRASGLAPGKYIVCAQMHPNQNKSEEPSGGKPLVGPVTTCYPSATSLDAASPIAVQSGQELDGVEIRVRSMQTFHVRGKIAGTLPHGTDMSDLDLELELENIGLMFFGGGARIAKNGSFDMTNVGPGSYDLSLFDLQNAPAALAKIPVTVSSSDVNGVVLQVIPPGDLHGTVRMEGAAQSGNAETVEITLLSEESNHIYGPPPQASADADGTFSILKVPAAKYRVNVMGVPSGAYLSAVRFNNQDLPDKVIDLSQGASGELEIVFHYGAVEIAGTVQMPQDAAASGLPSVSVVAVPDSGSGSVHDMKFDATDQNGTFTLHGLAPGAYHVYALEQGDRSLLQNPAVLKAILDKGVEIEVKENDKKQVQLPLISDDDMRQLLTALGVDEE